MDEVHPFSLPGCIYLVTGVLMVPVSQSLCLGAVLAYSLACCRCPLPSWVARPGEEPWLGESPGLCLL